MKRQIRFRALTFGIFASALFLTSCSTTETRISGHPEIFQSLSPRDQALVQRDIVATKEQDLTARRQAQDDLRQQAAAEVAKQNDLLGQLRGRATRVDAPDEASCEPLQASRRASPRSRPQFGGLYSPSRPHEERSSPKAPEQPHIGRFYDSQFLTSVEIVGCILADCRRAKTVTVCAAVSRAEPAPDRFPRFGVIANYA